MIFKPRIFISSTFNENTQTRRRIEELFSDSGAEVLMYEKNLTPSILSYTYRQNILDADFVIVILKLEYGNKTNTGLSGTHEEYRITRRNNIPMHVYIYDDSKEKDKEDKELKDFKNELKLDGISYFKYTDEDDLIQRISKTTFTIAKEIMIKNLDKVKIPDKELEKLVVNRDYEKALDVIKKINSFLNISNTLGRDLIQTNLLPTLYDDLTSKQERLFIDSELNKRLERLYKSLKNVTTKTSGISTLGVFLGTYKIQNYEIEVQSLNYIRNDDYGENYDEAQKLANKFLNNYKNFSRFIKNRKFESDLIQ
ncbi:MAG: DUF4062 domain-containing protein [Liquorilactobacillus ghanensis]|uniref:DUF4062 domain-containing protein n=1 Tax=Liquorilactobacillus ghanensis TaxID=399370 RepID=UPI0039ED14A3